MLKQVSVRQSWKFQRSQEQRQAMSKQRCHFQRRFA